MNDEIVFTYEDVVQMFSNDIIPDLKQAYEPDGICNPVHRLNAWEIVLRTMRDTGRITEQDFKDWKPPKICDGP